MDLPFTIEVIDMIVTLSLHVEQQFDNGVYLNTSNLNVFVYF